MTLPNLFWKRPNHTLCLLATPFKTEEEFEKTVFDTPEILEDIFLLKRQIRGGNKPGIPDIIGIDNDGNVCIIEMKNVDVDASIIPQVLQYAFWAESNPDSIKSLWRSLSRELSPSYRMLSRFFQLQNRMIFAGSSMVESDYSRTIPVPTCSCPTFRMLSFGVFVDQHPFC